MPIKLVIFLIVGTIAMSIPILVMSRNYQIKWWRALIVTVVLTLVGTVGTKVMFFIENGSFEGLSFYGAVFMVPIAFLPIAPLFHIPYGKILDLCAVGECIMLALMKVHCLISGCCPGRVLFVTAGGNTVVFPSRIAEMITVLVIFVVLLRWALNHIHQGELYCWYLLLYGSSRFILNFFRAEWAALSGKIPMGTVWSVCAVVIGIVWLAFRRKQLK